MNAAPRRKVGRPRKDPSKLAPKRGRGAPSREALFQRYLAVVQSFDTLADSVKLPLGAVCAVEGIALPTLWRMVKAGRLPRPEATGALRRISVGALRAARAQRAA